MEKTEAPNPVEGDTAAVKIVEEPTVDELKISDAADAKPTTPPPPPPPVLKVKRDFYQTESDVVVNFLAKNLKKEEVKVDFTDNTLSVEAKLADGTDYSDVIQLFNTVNPSACSFKVLSTKIEVRLRKQAAVTWTGLETAKAPSTTGFKPCYPSSSKIKKDWGKVEKEIEKEIPEDDNVNNLFSKIFSSGSEETQRAMMKSMVGHYKSQESGGTVLSTNWDEVGKKKTEVSPPDGMEWKKWDSSVKQ